MKYSILESAEDYAYEWDCQQATGGSLRAFIHARAAGLPSASKHPCFCDGGLPMMKPDCPKHGHLVRSGEERTEG